MVVMVLYCNCYDQELYSIDLSEYYYFQIYKFFGVVKYM